MTDVVDNTQLGKEERIGDKGTETQRHYSLFWREGFFGGFTLKFDIDSQLSLTSAMLKVKSFVAYSNKHMTLFVWALTIIISVHCWCSEAKRI